MLAYPLLRAVTAVVALLISVSLAGTSAPQLPFCEKDNAMTIEIETDLGLNPHFTNKSSTFSLPDGPPTPPSVAFRFQLGDYSTLFNNDTTQSNLFMVGYLNAEDKWSRQGYKLSAPGYCRVEDSNTWLAVTNVGRYKREWAILRGTSR